MANPHWLERLRCELRKRRLPAGYSARLIEELSDHFSDLQQENLSMDAQTLVDEKLGSPERVAAAAETEFLRRTFAGRHPVLAFMVVPVPVVLVLWFVVLLLCAEGKELFIPLEPLRQTPPSALQWIVTYTSMHVVRFVPFVLCAWLFSRWGCRAGRPAWGLAACTIVSYFAFIYLTEVQAPTEKHNLLVWCRPEFGLLRWEGRLLQALAPLAIGVWTCRQFGDTQNRHGCGNESESFPVPLTVPSHG